MKHSDAITLIDGPHFHALISPVHWADLGCGSGTFTLALASLLPAGSTIEAIDLRPGIKRQTTANGVTIVPRSADFVKDDLGLSNLDGILMANSLHYVREKLGLLKRLAGYSTGPLLLVEYDTDRPTPVWVPYPISFAAAADLLPAAGWLSVEKLGSRPSAYGRNEMYAALARRG